MSPVEFVLPPEGTFAANNDVDPLRFYYTPLIGRVFAARLNVGLRLLPEGCRYRRVLEAGYGSGLLLPTLATITEPAESGGELHGIDREAAPEGLAATLKSVGAHAILARGELEKLPYADGYFDLVVAFSVLEHLRADELPTAIAELARVCSGSLLVGCPAVHGAMNAAFAAIGFPDIANHHFSSLPDVLRAAEPYFTLRARSAWPAPMALAPFGWAPYGCVLLDLRKKSGRG